jgi:peptidoglycan hydrolase-like protein with peptidoglycan-binding domain
MYKLTTIAITAALGLAWTVLPAGAQETLKNKAERTGDKIEDKAERTKDKLENKSERAADKMENKAERAKDKADGKDTVGEKLDRAVDKTKAKAREAKDKVSSKMDRGDTRNAQQALQAKGYNPGPIDGVHGPRTSAALRDYQKAEGLKVTGEMDGDTRARLMAQSSPAAPAASPATTPASPSTVGSPSQAPAATEKVEKK